ncbi:hypothetical protein BDZ45DRAFT_441519 [Acephala macrosclerotiorum]|nr:hypothetical protein BDZ45DRAFT_441519 [Acephala macrosclerotiorum]
MILSLRESNRTLPSQTQKPTHLYNHFSPSFRDVTSAIKRLDVAFRWKQLWAILLTLPRGNDLASIGTRRMSNLRALRLGLLFAPKELPVLYHRIRLSNVP